MNHALVFLESDHFMPETNECVLAVWTHRIPHQFRTARVDEDGEWRLTDDSKPKKKPDLWAMLPATL